MKLELNGEYLVERLNLSDTTYTDLIQSIKVVRESEKAFLIKRQYGKKFWFLKTWNVKILERLDKPTPIKNRVWFVTTHEGGMMAWDESFSFLQAVCGNPEKASEIEASIKTEISNHKELYQEKHGVSYEEDLEKYERSFYDKEIDRDEVEEILERLLLAKSQYPELRITEITIEEKEVDN